MRHSTHRRKRILFAHEVRSILRASGLDVRHHHEGFFITPTATLRPHWGISRHGARKLGLRISGRLSPVAVGGLHFRGIPIQYIWKDETS